MEAAVALRPGNDPEVEARVAEEPDLVVELSIARAHGRSILGRAPGHRPVDEWEARRHARTTTERQDHLRGEHERRPAAKIA
jgi:hypothetical protein